MTKVLLIALLLIAGFEVVAAQDQAPDNKSEAATPAPPALQNAPPDKVGTGVSSDTARPDTKAEATSPELKMDTGADKKLPMPDGEPRPR